MHQWLWGPRKCGCWLVHAPQHGIPVVPMVMLQQNHAPGARTRHLYHVMDKWPDGLGKYPPSVFADETDQGMMMMECPSTELGMTGDEEAAQ